MRETLRFLRARLASPLRVRDTCASRAERAASLRFFAVDDTPLVGVELGSGPVGIALAHGYQGSLCDWLPYARELASDGYRVLAYDARSDIRVDLDAEAAVEALYRAGSQRVVVVGSSLGALPRSSPEPRSRSRPPRSSACPRPTRSARSTASPPHGGFTPPCCSRQPRTT